MTKLSHLALGFNKFQSGVCVKEGSAKAWNATKETSKSMWEQGGEPAAPDGD
jgi:hypothetical protein